MYSIGNLNIKVEHDDLASIDGSSNKCELKFRPIHMPIDALYTRH